MMSPDGAVDALRQHWNHTDEESSVMAQDSAVLYIYPNVSSPASHTLIQFMNRMAVCGTGVFLLLYASMIP